MGTLLVSGIMIGSLFSALVSLVKFVADQEQQLPSITYWLMGSLQSATYTSLTIGLVPILISVVVLFLLRWRLNLLLLSEEEAVSSGANIRTLRLIAILCATAVTASSISMCGQVGWVGLIVPHMCRMMLGNDHRRLIPASVSLGGSFMIIVDTIARSATAAEILSMEDEAIAQVKFHMVFTNSSPDGEMTYTLSGGSDWSNVAFYSNVGCSPADQISSITFSESAEVWGLGTIVKSKIAFASDSLTVTLTDINGDVACTSKIEVGAANWTFTDPTESSTKISVTNNSVGDSEYKYAIKIVNDDNFTKRFTLVPEGIGDSWYVTYVCGDDIVVLCGFTVTGTELRLHLHLPDALSPASLGKSGDIRLLALSMKSIVFNPIDP